VYLHSESRTVASAEPATTEVDNVSMVCIKLIAIVKFKSDTIQVGRLI